MFKIFLEVLKTCLFDINKLVLFIDLKKLNSRFASLQHDFLCSLSKENSQNYIFETVECTGCKTTNCLNCLSETQITILMAKLSMEKNKSCETKSKN